MKQGRDNVRHRKYVRAARIEAKGTGTLAKIGEKQELEVPTQNVLGSSSILRGPGYQKHLNRVRVQSS